MDYRMQSGWLQAWWQCSLLRMARVLVTQLCLSLCDPMDCSLPGSLCVHGILQARILEWIVISFSSGSSRPRDWTWVSCIAGSFFIIWAMKEALILANRGGHYPEPHAKMKWMRSCQHSCRTPFCHGKRFFPLSISLTVPWKRRMSKNVEPRKFYLMVGG